MRIVFIVLGIFFSSVSSANVTLGKMKPLTLKKGAAHIAQIPISIEKGFHIQANPASLSQLIATTLTFESTKEILVGPTQYPKGKPYRVESMKSEIDVYDGNIDLSVPLAVNKEIKNKKTEIKGVLRYQACTEKTCFFPKNLPVVLVIHNQ